MEPNELETTSLPRRVHGSRRERWAWSPRGPQRLPPVRPRTRRGFVLVFEVNSTSRP